MPKVLTNSRDNFLSIYGLVDIFSSWLDQSLTITSSPTFVNLTLTGDAQIDGNLTVTGNTTILDSTSLLIKDNIIELNSSEEGTGVTLNLAGIQIERGSLVDYQIVFRESDDSVVIGEIGDLQTVATREDNPLSNGVMTFNSIDRRLDSVNDISIPITFSANEDSTSSITGSVRIQGGIGIDNTTDSIDSTNGGSLTVLGGGAIGKKLHVGNSIHISGSDAAGMFMYPNAVGVENSVRYYTDTYANGGGQSWRIGTGVASQGVDTFALYSSTATANVMTFNSTGQMRLTRSIASSSSTTGVLYLDGGIGVDNTTDAVSIANGGTFTSAGGGAFAKKLFVGGSSNFSKNIDISTTSYAGTNIVSHGLLVGGNTFTDTSTAGSGTSSNNNMVNLKRTILAAQNLSVTTTNAATLYIEGSPIQGTNQTLTNMYSLFVDSGISRFDGQVNLTANISSSSSTTGTLVVTGGVGISQNLNVSGSSSFGPTQVDTSTGTFSVLGSGSVSYLLTGTIDIKSSVNDITIDAQNADLILDGHTSVSVDSTGPITIDTTNIINGIKIGTETSSVPITIGHSSSEVIVSDNLTVVGDLTINGTTTTVNSVSVTVQDNAIIVNSLPNSLSDGGMLVRRYQIPNNAGTGGQIILDVEDTSSTFNSGSSIPSTLVLNSSASLVDNYYRGWWIKITSGAGNNQVRRIKSYDGASQTATIYVTSENTPTFLDGLNLSIAPSSGDSYNLYSGTYSGSFYDDTNDEWVLGKVPFDTGAGIFPLVAYQDLHVKGLTVETVTGFVTNPSLTTSNLTNISSVTTANVAMISTSPDRTLSGCFRVTPTTSFMTTSFEFILSDVVTNWSNPYDITITLNGHRDNVNFYSVENIVGYAVPGTVRAKIKFTSGSTSEHVIQFIARYTIV